MKNLTHPFCSQTFSFLSPLISAYPFEFHRFLLWLRERQYVSFLLDYLLLYVFLFFCKFRLSCFFCRQVIELAAADFRASDSHLIVPALLIEPCCRIRYELPLVFCPLRAFGLLGDRCKYFHSELGVWVDLTPRFECYLLLGFSRVGSPELGE